MKKIFFVLACLVLLFFSITQTAKAEIYGYVLTLDATDSGSVVNNGSMLQESALAGQLKVVLTVPDPSFKTTPQVTKWQFKIKSFTGKTSLGEAVFGFDQNSRILTTDPNLSWDLNNISLEKNKLTIWLKLKNLKVDSVELSALAWVSTHQTNLANTKILFTTNNLVVAPVVRESQDFFAKFTEFFGKIITSQQVVSIGFPLVFILLLIWLILVIRRPRKPWGRVLDAESRKPIAQVDVSLILVKSTISPINPVVSKKLTNKEGEYSFPEKAGQYQLEVKFDGFEFSQDESSYQAGQIVKVYQGRTPVIPDILMKKINKG